MTAKFNNAAVWLMMLKEGGRWSAAEVGERTGQDQTAAASALRAMHEFGTLRRWEKSPTDNRVRFGVTAVCKIPRGIALSDILACDLSAADAA